MGNKSNQNSIWCQWLPSLSWNTKLWKGSKPWGIVFHRDKLPQNITRKSLSIWKALFLKSNSVSVVVQKPCNLEKTKVSLACSLWKVFNPYNKLDTQRKPGTKKNLNYLTFFLLNCNIYFNSKNFIISGLFSHADCFLKCFFQICLNWDISKFNWVNYNHLTIHSIKFLMCFQHIRALDWHFLHSHLLFIHTYIHILMAENKFGLHWLLHFK